MRQATHRHRRPHWCGGRRRDRRAWLRCPWAAAGPGRGAGRRRQGQGGPRDRPLRAKLACGDLAGGPPPTSTHSGQAHQGRPRDGRKSAGASGARNTRGATSNKPRKRPPTGTTSSPARQHTNAARNTSSATSNTSRKPPTSTHSGQAQTCVKPRPADAGRGFRYPVGYEV